jgi:hypothetical protein
MTVSFESLSILLAQLLLELATFHHRDEFTDLVRAILQFAEELFLQMRMVLENKALPNLHVPRKVTLYPETCQNQDRMRSETYAYKV